MNRPASQDPRHADDRWQRWLAPERRARALILLAGLVLSQAILFGPSLSGQKILLPLDLLALPRCYLPETPQYEAVEPGNQVFSDLILEYEPSRVFATRELRDGRLPLWNSHCFTGAPFLFPTYSPFAWPYYLFGTPYIVAWTQLLVAVVTGIGSYLFFRRALAAAFWPAALGAWCYPLTGFFAMWQGFSLTYGAAWLPWILLAADGAVRNPRGWGGPGLALVSGLVLVSSQPDISGQVLVASGLYAIARWLAVYRRRLHGAGTMPAFAVGSVVGAWMLGFLLASPHLLPFVEYVQTGSRYAARIEGREERPPVGVAALPQLVLPDVYGSSRRGSIYVGPINQLESPAAGYAGLLLTLVVAPLALRARRERALSAALAVLALVALSWTLDLPGFVQVLRLPLLDVMSHNRFVFVSSFALVGLAVIGLGSFRESDSDHPHAGAGDAASPRSISRGWISRRWALFGSLLPLALGAYCLYHSFHLPTEIASGLANALQRGEPRIEAPSLEAIARITRSFRSVYLQGAVLSLLAISAWWYLSARWTARWVSHGAASEVPRRARDGISRWSSRRTFATLLGLAAWCELVAFSFGFNPQADPELYYPSIPVLEKLGAATTDRFLGAVCLPAPLGQRFGLKDVRGYDGVDPARLIDLLDLCWDPEDTSPRHSATQWLVPVVDLTSDGDLALSPILSLLDVRYLVFRGDPPPSVRAVLAGDDYWVAENPAALPRPFIPRHVAPAPERAQILARMGDPRFDPAETAFVEGAPSPLLRSIIEVTEPARGRARIVREHSQRIEIEAEMETPGLLVLSDLWNAGWRATLNGERVPIWRTDHALRGIAAPAGRCSLVLEYRPSGLLRGFWMALTGLFLGGVWALWVRRHRARGVEAPRCGCP